MNHETLKSAAQFTNTERSHEFDIQETIESQKQADLNRFIEDLSGRMALVKKAGGWSDFNESLSDRTSLSDDEKDSIKTATDILKQVDAVSDKKSIFRRSTRRLLEIATAFNLLRDRRGIQGEVGGALESLLNAVSELATKEEIEASSEAMGLMTKQQMEESKEHISKLNVS